MLSASLSCEINFMALGMSSLQTVVHGDPVVDAALGWSLGIQFGVCVGWGYSRQPYLRGDCR